MISSTGILSIDLAAIKSNWSLVAAKLAAGVQCATVVKADAYSVGAVPVSLALYQAGCRHFYLATANEAVSLRQQLPADAVLYVLAGVREGAEQVFVDQRLIPVLYSMPAVRQWLDFCSLQSEAYACALKLETGMTRLGLDMKELDDLLVQQSANPFFNPVVFMSHLACADEPAHPLNAQQLARFKQAAARVKQRYPSITLSLANSSGTFLGSEYHFDMVRIGAALYGINPQPGAVNPLAPVINLKLPVLQVRVTEADASVGYGASAQVAAGTRLAVVAGGYADGAHRTLGLAPQAEIAGVSVNAVGRISMDSCIFDITASPVHEPDYVEVVNTTLTLDALMARTHSLGYEVLTSLGARYKRLYIGGDQ